ncbi:MAG: pyrroloquinoline quinone-dependent dehydrogenase [Vicinamibacterales bacterium]|nr:pyrroloquinoline quinone-dependent dehydrogenase [Vicinamibacterales bacterium]
MPRMPSPSSFLVCAACCCAVLLWPALGLAQYGATNGEWRSYGGDLGSTKYSPLDQIDAANFGDLRMAWRWQTVDASLDMEAIREQVPRIQFRMFQASPLMVDGVLYISTALQQVAAIDAGTGETLWVHNPEYYLEGQPTHFYNSRGVAYWEDDEDPNDARIFFGTHGGYLLALDADTGQPVREFGIDGRVDLMEGIPRAVRGETNYNGRNLIGVASPPIVAHDVVVTPSVISDSAIKKEAPPGWVRGVDARTGDTKWMFRTVPQADDFGADSWQNESWRYSGNTNVWSFLSVDDELGYVYLPTGTPTGDYYGGHRLGDNLFAESVVALDIETGQRMWHFQAVHHGVWDYDFPAAPNLVDITVDGRPVKALAQVSKQGFTYVFDRVTGDPVWPIEERPVATDSDLEGEVLSPTQPFPTKPPPFEYQGVTIDDLVDFTPEIRAMAVEAVKDFRLGPLFSPPMLSADGGLHGTIQRPYVGGGANWSGAAVDPETGLLYVPSLNRFSVLKYYTPDSVDGGNLRYTFRGLAAGVQPQMPQGLPLLKPPYTRMTAIDLNAGEHAWMQPNGDGNRLRNHPLLRDLDLPPLGGDGRGGPLLTKTLLVSALTAGGADDGPRLVARDKATGEILASVGLPGGAIGTPMTYMLDGRQHIALTVGGEVPELIALALP